MKWPRTTASYPQNALALRQSKNTAGCGSATLRTHGVVAALNAFWRFREANRTRRVSLAYLTTSTPGREQGVAWPGDRPGLVFWREAARDGVDLADLRGLLLTLALDAELKAWLGTAGYDEVRTELLRPVRWECGEPPIGELDALLHERLVILCDRLGAAASYAHALRSLVVVELLRAATDPEAHARRRSRARLLELWVPLRSTVAIWRGGSSRPHAKPTQARPNPWTPWGC